ncbi:hypothetical protein ACP4OV_011787 [Aristida adscensionis]
MAMALRALAGKLRVLPGRAAASRARAFASQKEKRSNGIPASYIQEYRAFLEMSPKEQLRHDWEEMEMLKREHYMYRKRLLATAGCAILFCVSATIVALAEEDVAEEEVAKEEVAKEEVAEEEIAGEEVAEEEIAGEED